MTGQPPGGIEGLVGGPRRAAILLVVFIVVAGVAIGALAFVAFGRHNAPTPSAGQPGTVQTPHGTAPQSQPCEGSPSVDGATLQLTRDGLMVDTFVRTSCESDDVLAGPAVRVTVADGTRDIAAGVFDLDSAPIVISPGQQAHRQFLFPAGMYWRTPELVGAYTLTVDITNFTRPGSDATPVLSGSTSLTAMRPLDPAHGSADGTAANALKELSGADYRPVKSGLENRWVPQISSKKVGLYTDGITYTNVDILRDHLTLRQRYEGVRLVSSEDWTTFNGSNWWITVVARPSSDAASANRWCDAHGIDPFNCFAKMISSTLGPDGTTVFRK
jgi:hypothetical protein